MYWQRSLEIIRQVRTKNVKKKKFWKQNMLVKSSYLLLGTLKNTGLLDIETLIPSFVCHGLPPFLLSFLTPFFSFVSFHLPHLHLSFPALHLRSMCLKSLNKTLAQLNIWSMIHEPTFLATIYSPNDFHFFPFMTSKR